MPPPPFDAGDDPGVFCGDLNTATECAVGSTVCCRRDVGGTQTNVCTLPTGCVGQGLAIPCDDTTDCEQLGFTDSVCCIDIDPTTNAATKVSCIKTSECASTNGNNRTNMCDPSQPDNVTCPNGGNCGQSQGTLPPYNICL
jgi:hypothetical protein